MSSLSTSIPSELELRAVLSGHWKKCVDSLVAEKHWVLQTAQLDDEVKLVASPAAFPTDISVATGDCVALGLVTGYRAFHLVKSPA